jgi:MOSC domain-containing protein YiiM
MGGVFKSAALGRFARTLGTLVKSGVSLLPALKIVENTIGNRVLAQAIAQVTEETRGGPISGGTATQDEHLPQQRRADDRRRGRNRAIGRNVTQSGLASKNVRCGPEPKR